MPPGNHHGHGGGRRGAQRRVKANPNGAEEGNRDGHHDDDRGRADLRQTRPSLVAADADMAAAPLLEEFAALGIQARRAEPVFPPRPGYGAAGTPCVVRANRFLARFVDEGLHHYDVSARPLSPPHSVVGFRLISPSAAALCCRACGVAVRFVCR